MTEYAPHCCVVNDPWGRCCARDYREYVECEQLRQRELKYQSAPQELKQLWFRRKLAFVDLIDPLPPPSSRRYPLSTWRSSEKVEDRVSIICENIATADKGIRNYELNNGAFIVGMLCQKGLVDVATACYRLGQAARACGLPIREAAEVTKRAMAAGARRA